MTYCLGIQIEEGLIGLADTRVLAGNEVRIASKTWVWQRPEQAMFIMTSGLRSVRDKVMVNFEESMEKECSTTERLFRAVNLLSAEIRRSWNEDRTTLEEAGLSFNTHALVGGQFSGDKSHQLFLVYPEGNWIQIGTDAPYETIGAAGFGKPIVKRCLRYQDSMQYAFKVGLLSFDSTRVCAADVDYPVDVLLYQRDSFRVVEHRYQEEELREISFWWHERLRESVAKLPVDTLNRAFSKLAVPAGVKS